MATKTSAPSKKTTTSNNSQSYSPGPREARGTPTPYSTGGLNKVSGKDPDVGTGGHC